MKPLIAAIILIVMTTFSIQAQQNHTGLSTLLNSYYEVKEALVNADAETAVAKASQFIQASNDFDIKTLPGDKIDAFTALQKKLITDAERIKTTKDITKQREYFGTFSLDFYSLAKRVKLSAQPVYQVYCPMKKMYWLNYDRTIRNPYYGHTMLSCGQITETINL
jgi:hypothetical protein